MQPGIESERRPRGLNAIAAVDVVYFHLDGTVDIYSDFLIISPFVVYTTKQGDLVRRLAKANTVIMSWMLK